MPLITITKPSTKIVQDAICLQLASVVHILYEASLRFFQPKEKDELLKVATDLLKNTYSILQQYEVYLSDNKNLFFKAHLLNLQSHANVLAKDKLFYEFSTHVVPLLTEFSTASKEEEIDNKNSTNNPSYKQECTPF